MHTLKNIQLKSVVFLIALAISFSISAQTASNPEIQWGKSISQFEKQDSVSLPKADGILLLGSSSFTIWKDIVNDFPGKNIINRGFGGSQMSDVLYFKERLILPYHPRQLVIYEGENDIASGEKPDSILSELVRLVSWTRKQIPEIRITLISMKPCPLRWKIRETMLEMNKDLKQFASESKNMDFINIWDPLLGPDGKPIKVNYLNDSLHLNANGYKIWQKVMNPFLK